MAGYKGNGTYCKGKTHSTQLDTIFTKLSLLVKLSKSDLLDFIWQNWICATGLTGDVQKMLCALRSQQVKGPVPAERVILEMELYAWVRCP